MALPSVSSLWTFARKIDRVLEAEAKQVRVNDALQQQIACAHVEAALVVQPEVAAIAVLPQHGFDRGGEVGQGSGFSGRGRMEGCRRLRLRTAAGQQQACAESGEQVTTTRQVLWCDQL